VYDHQLFLRTVSDFARLLLQPYDVDATLHELSQRATEVFGLAGSGVSLVVEDRLVYDTAVPDSLAPLARAQGESQEGPCVQACRTGEVVAVTDLAHKTDGWEAYRAAAATLGVSLKTLYNRLKVYENNVS